MEVSYRTLSLFRVLLFLCRASLAKLYQLRHDVQSFGSIKLPYGMYGQLDQYKTYHYDRFVTTEVINILTAKKLVDLHIAIMF